MGISNWPSGATDPILVITFVTDAGAAINLTGATMTTIIRNTTTLQDKIGAGSWVVSGASASYTPDPTDSALTGNAATDFELIFKYVIGQRIGIGDPIAWNVVPV